MNKNAPAAPVPQANWMQNPVQLWQSNTGDPKPLTQADIDKAVKAALASAKEEWDAEKETEVAGLKANKAELIAENRALKKGQEIKPETLEAAEARADKAEADLAELAKQVKTLTTERDKAVKSLETEQNAARNYALDAEINGAIAKGNIVPDLAAGLTAMMRGGAKVELVDGKYVAMIGDKPAGEHIAEFLGGDAGKAWRAAPANGGGGAPGGKGTAPAGKTITKAEFDALPVKDRVEKMSEGYTLVTGDA